MPDLKPIAQSDDPRKDWRTVNQLLSELLTLRGEVRRLSSAVETLRHKVPYRTAGASGGGQVFQCKVKAIGDESLTCVEYTGLTEGDSITVLKPWKLRRSSYDGKSFILPGSSWTGYPDLTLQYTYQTAQERTVYNTTYGLTSWQAITPRYLVGDIIYAAEFDDGGTLYVDISEGRAWAKFG